MANRYLIKSSNWNDASAWSSTSGGAGGASVPTSSDDVTLDKNYTVTLVGNISINSLDVYNGTISAVSYNVTVAQFVNAGGNNNRTINMGSGVWTVNGNGMGTIFSLKSYGTGNTTLNAGSSLLIINYTDGYFITSGATFNDVRINMNGTSETLNITGSPTFRLLDIRSANSAAHTVNFDDSVEVRAEKFIAIGTSSANRLLLTSQTPGYFGVLRQSASGTVYGQNINNGIFGGAYSGENNMYYIGAGSTTSNGAGYGWLLQDPPKISTLVDPLTTAPGSNSNWNLPSLPGGNILPTPTNTGRGGGGYKFNQGSANWSLLRSAGTYDLIDSSVVFEIDNRTINKYAILTSLLYTKSSSDLRQDSGEMAGAGASSLLYQVYGAGRNSSGTISSASSGTHEFIEVAVSAGGVMTWSLWNGAVFVQKGSYTIPADDVALYRSRRIDLHGTGDGIIGSINPSFTSTPTVTTGAATSLTDTTVTVAGNVTSDGGATVTERGVVYSTSTTPTTSDTKVTAAGTTGSFTSSLTGLTENTKYYVRSYAINSIGTAYGSEINFTTTVTFSATTGTTGAPTLNGVAISNNVISNPKSYTLTEYGIAYAMTALPTIADNKKTSSGSIAGFSVSLTGLSESTTYYARAYATYSGVTRYGSQVSFKTTGRPIVTINSPANNGITGDLAPRLEFTGTDSDNERIEYQLQANPTNSFTSPAIDATTGFTNLDTPADTSPFLPANKIRYTYPTNLARGSDLYWRVRGRDPAGSNQWGEWTTASKLTIDTIAPTVGITGVTDVLDTSINITSNITDEGGATITERGICWSLTANPTTADSKATGTGNPFTVAATGLTGATTYNFRAYAINAKGTSYSGNVTQQTEQTEQPPTLTTADATGIYYTNANVGGEVTLDGRHTVTERGVVFGTSANPTTADRKYTAPTAGLGSFSGGITALDPDTTYHMRAYAINSEGTGYGADKTFTTLALPANEDDGYWVFSNTDSTAVVARTQATPKNSSADLYIEPFLTVGKTYTIHVGNISADAGTPKLVLEYIDGTLQSFTIAQNTAKTFTYSGTTSLVRLRLYVTAGTTVAGELTATFEDMYMAEEGSFSSFVPFERRGAKEIKIINNQILDKRREDVLPTLYSKLLGLRYTPFDITTEGLGYFEVYDGFKIKDPNDDEITVLMTDKKLTLDGGIQEKLQGKTPDKTETDYSKAGGITKLLSQTTLQVDKQKGNIEALVQDVYDNDGYIENKFSQVYQDVNQVKTTVQGAGGVNLVRNSAMFAYNNLGYPDSWTTTVGGSGTITIQGDPESRNAGAIAGNSFTLKDATVKQTVTVRKDADFIAADQKTYYAFNAKVKKNLVGDAYIKLSNINETHQIDLESGTAYFWEDITFESLLPLDDNYQIEIYSDSDAQLQVTDVILSVGEFRHEWTPSAGELGNASVSITEDGMTIRQAQFKYNYLKLDALGIEVNQKVIGQDWQIFGFNGAETNTYQLKTEKQFTMGGMRILPIDDGAGLTGWAFTPKEGA